MSIKPDIKKKIKTIGGELNLKIQLYTGRSICIWTPVKAALFFFIRKSVHFRKSVFFIILQNKQNIVT